MESLLLKPLSSRDLLSAVAQLAVPASLSPGEDLALIRRLRVQFQQELPGLRLALANARAEGDLARARERLHYLKNSADVVRYAELSALCAQAEALVAQDAGDFQRALDELLAFLARLPLPDDTTPFRPSPEK
jgi:HPt (histidine-containing phosphotransfer) domain-containing protein